MQSSNRFPDPATTGVVVSGEWTVGATGRLPDGADAITGAWAALPWPTGLTSYSIYLDADGGQLRDYAQWRDEAAADAFETAGRRQLLDLINEADPDLRRRDDHRYRLYRGSRSATGRVGAMVAVRVDTDGVSVAEAWIDAVFAALAHDRNLPPGGLGAFFHISTDGRQVLNYAEWVSAAAHRQAVTVTGRGISQGPMWDKIQHTPGVRPQSVTRYHLHRTLTP